MTQIDHFMCNERLFEFIEECAPIHSGDNLSRHLPIFLKLRVDDIPRSVPVNINNPRQPAWYKAGELQTIRFARQLHEKITELHRPECLYCTDVLMYIAPIVKYHSRERYSYVLNLLSVAIKVSHATIPMTSDKM